MDLLQCVSWSFHTEDPADGRLLHAAPPLDLKPHHHRGLSAPDRPTAIFAAANTDTLGVTRALHDLGLAQRVGQIVFDDIDFADMLTPPLSAYSQDPVELGRLCGQAILRRAAATAPEPRFQTLPGRLVARGSGEIAPQ